MESSTILQPRCCPALRCCKLDRRWTCWWLGITPSPAENLKNCSCRPPTWETNSHTTPGACDTKMAMVASHPTCANGEQAPQFTRRYRNSKYTSTKKVKANKNNTHMWPEPPLLASLLKSRMVFPSALPAPSKVPLMPSRNAFCSPSSVSISSASYATTRQSVTGQFFAPSQNGTERTCRISPTRPRSPSTASSFAASSPSRSPRPRPPPPPPPPRSPNSSRRRVSSSGPARGRSISTTPLLWLGQRGALRTAKPPCPCTHTMHTYSKLARRPKFISHHPKRRIKRHPPAVKSSRMCSINLKRVYTLFV